MTERVLSGEAVRFEAEHRPLAAESPELGTVALLPWDAEIFGFRVGDYLPGPPRALVGRTEDLGAQLGAWAAREDAELVGCRVSARPAALGALIEEAGFRFIEVQLRATLPRLRAEDLRAPRLTVRTAEGADHPRIAEIAASAFVFGRYHADPRFPREAADRRYRVWIERACAAPSSGSWIGVVGPPGAPRGFLQAEISAGPGISGATEDSVRTADIRLAAVDPESAGIAGPELFLGSLHELVRRGVSSVTARISAVNSAVWNIYASLGFRFHEPELVFHWHRPGSKHLVTLDDSLAGQEGADGQERAG